jgi:hypothetical protein
MYWIDRIILYRGWQPSISTITEPNVPSNPSFSAEIAATASAGFSVVTPQANHLAKARVTMMVNLIKNRYSLALHGGFGLLAQTQCPDHPLLLAMMRGVYEGLGSFN